MHFLHPSAAYLFLLFIPLLALSLRKPTVETVVVPSLSFWKSMMSDEKTERNKPGLFFPPLSLLIFLGGMSLLIVALMTPISSHVHLPDTVNTLAIRYTSDLSEPAQRVLDHLDNTIPLKEGVVIPEGIPILTVCDAPCDPETEGNILLTTGSKELRAYAEIPRERLYVRVLPTWDSIAACEAAGIPHRNIIAMFGPFSQRMNEAMLEQYRISMNEAMLEQYRISYLVTKEAGRNGGFEEKMQAAKRCGVNAIVIRRPEDFGVTVEEAAAMLKSL